MKKLFITITILCCVAQLHLASAQSAELQQLALNLEKLAQFKQILSDMKKGYDVLNKGYSTIKGLSQGNFSLHDNFLNSLLSVSPALRRYKKISDIITYQSMLLSEYKSAFKSFKQNGRFNPGEITYMAGVYNRLFDQSLRDLDDLTTILTAGSLRMSDDERLQGIDRIYADMQGRLGFLRSFNSRVSAVDAQRQRETKAAQTLKGLMQPKKN